MRKTIVLGVGLLLFPLLLGGCWDIRYLDQLSIVMAIGLDQAPNKEIQVTVQVTSASEASSSGSKGGGGGSKNASTQYTENGATVFEAVRKIARKTSRTLYFSHNQVMVIGEELARQGIGPLFEFIERDPEVRTDFYLLIAKGAKASEILNITTPIEKIPAQKMRNSIKNVEKLLGTSYGVTIKEIIENIGSGKREIIAGSIETVGDSKKGSDDKNIEKISPSALLQLNGLAVFKEEKLVDFFGFNESRGTSLILDKIKNMVVAVPCKQKGKTAIEVIHSSTDLKARFQQGQPTISIRVEQEANIGEVQCPDLDVSTREAFDQLEKGMEEQIKKAIDSAVKKAKKQKTDIFGFASAVYKANPAYWKQNQNNWIKIFKKMPVHIEVETKIKREGMRGKSYYRKQEKGKE